MLGPIVLRRTKAMKGPDGQPLVALPPRRVEVVRLTLSPEEAGPLPALPAIAATAAAGAAAAAIAATAAAAAAAAAAASDATAASACGG